MPSNKRLSSILDGPSDTPAVSTDGKSASAAAPQPQSTGLPPGENSPDTRQQHTRSPSSSSASYSRNQTMTPPPPPFASNHRASTSGTSSSQHHSSVTRNPTASNSSTPPRIRQTRSEVHPAHGAQDGLSKYASGQLHDDPSKNNNYALWLPWEESALVDWLFEPNNCKLFNEPRRKKECHERIIHEILPNKTSRAIEGKIRTLEKRYLKAAGEIKREDFATIHPGKRPDDVAEALCNNFYKLETIFSALVAHPRVSQSQSTPNQNKRKNLWGNKSILSSNPSGNPSDGVGGVTSQIPPASGYDQASGTSQTVAGSNAGSGSGNANGVNGLSVPRGSPPRISATESLPLPYRMMQFGRKIAPKRDADNVSSIDGADMGSDPPNMMSSSKRSRTFPASMQNRRSP
ncbi:hypothetical protein EV179_004660, partial [Coemansia sp. RSA 487]